MRKFFIVIALLSLSGLAFGQTFNFYGYKGTKTGGDIVVEPHTAAAGNPWIWRARFWGHEPQVDTALLAKGFVVAYCDVADLYGSPKAMQRFDEFYKQMVSKNKLSPKVVLEGMSRGGLPIFNWAARNADKVAAIYADAPVMDIKSWPMKSSPEDNRKMMAAYNFTDSLEAVAWNKNPIDNAAALVGIPIIAVVGMADTIVPVAENTDLFKSHYQAAGGFMTVIRKQGIGHHPHSLTNPKIVVDFILSAVGMVENRCATPVAGVEWRSGAGWVAGADWWANHSEISALLQRPTDVLLLGNSITQGFGGERQIVTYKPGIEELEKVLIDKSWVSAGISGDKTQHLLWRLENGDYGTAKPKNVFITIGVNNLTSGDSPVDVAMAIIEIGKKASEIFPQAKIVVFGTLPFYDMEAQNTVQTVLNNYSQMPANVKFIDPTEFFISNGNLIEQYYVGDKLHLSQWGYRQMCNIIARQIRDSDTAHRASTLRRPVVRRAPLK